MVLVRDEDRERHDANSGSLERPRTSSAARSRSSSSNVSCPGWRGSGSSRRGGGPAAGPRRQRPPVQRPPVAAGRARRRQRQCVQRANPPGASRGPWPGSTCGRTRFRRAGSGSCRSWRWRSRAWPAPGPISGRSPTGKGRRTGRSPSRSRPPRRPPGTCRIPARPWRTSTSPSWGSSTPLVSGDGPVGLDELRPLLLLRSDHPSLADRAPFRFARLLSEVFGIDFDALATWLARVRRDRARVSARPREPGSPPPSRPPGPRSARPAGRDGRAGFTAPAAGSGEAAAADRRALAG